MAHRRLAAAVSVLAVTSAAGAVAVERLSGRGEGPSGTGLRYGGAFYLLSGAEVLDARLGPVLDRDVPFQDTSTALRGIVDVDPSVAVAALVRDVGGTPSAGGSAWLLLSPDEDLAARPWADPALAAAVHAERTPG